MPTVRTNDASNVVTPVGGRLGLPVIALLAALLAVLTGCGGTNQQNEPDPGGVSPVSAPGLRCAEDRVESSIYDYGPAPSPDGEAPLEAVQGFFGDDVAEETQLEVRGLEVHMIQEARTVAIIGLIEVPGGYVVESYDACPGVIRR